MLHLVKLCVGIRDVAHLQEAQARRLQADPPLRHQTRNSPRRTAELLDGGSIYWVIAGAIVVRQPIIDIIQDRWDDDTACAGLVLDPRLVPVAARPTRAFQGWRYLAADAAPPDLGAADPAGGCLPDPLQRELRALGLL